MKKIVSLILIILIITMITPTLIGSKITKQDEVLATQRKAQILYLPNGELALNVMGFDSEREAGAPFRNIASVLPPSKGDWIINSTIVVKDISLIINGSIIVDVAGTLILDNSSIYMNLESDGEYRIDVYGNLTLLKSMITAYNITNNYYIRVFSGAQLRVEDSEISYAGYTWGVNGDKTGLWINTNNTVIINTTIQNNYYGALLYYSSGNVIRDSIIRFASYGLFLRGASYNLITNVVIENTSMFGIAMDSSSNRNAIYNNTIRNNEFYGIFLYASYDNKIFFNNFINNKYHSSIIPEQLTTTSNVTYIYAQRIQNNKLGNYWDSYNGSDPNSDGVGNETYLGDTHPLMEPTWNYLIGDTDHDNLDDILEEALGTSTNNGDTDFDGLPDGWEVKHGLDPLNSSDALLDLDDDGLSNMREYAYGTDPLNFDTDGDGAFDGWETRYGLNPLKNDSYVDMDGDGLTSLEEFGFGTDPTNSDTDSDNMPDGWETSHGLDPLNYLDANTDLDADGLTNLKEYQWDTNPKNPDTDNDGLSDGWEVFYNLDPTSNDSFEDSDGDGLTNFEEYQHKTNPTMADTDLDSMPDGWEVLYGLNPRNSSDSQQDIDKDGLSNAREYWFGTDPTNPDTDGDGYTDGIEVLRGSDPLDPGDYIAPKVENTTSTQSTSESVFPSIYWLVILIFGVTTLISIVATFLTLKSKSSP